MVASLDNACLCASLRRCVASTLSAGGDVIGALGDVGDVVGATGCAATTLGRGANTLGSGGKSGDGASVMACCTTVWLVKMLVSCWRAARFLSSIGAMAVARDGFLRVTTRSAAAVIALLLEPGMYMTTLVGSQINGSLTRSALVSQNHTR